MTSTTFDSPIPTTSNRTEKAEVKGSEEPEYDAFNPKGVPPIERHYHQIVGWPGEVVVENIHEDTQYDKSFEFTLRKVTAGVDTRIDPKEAHLIAHGAVHYSATTPYRAVVWTGDTPGAALGNMLRGFSELSRSGALDPKDPNEKGATPIQHVLEILSERLAWQMGSRRANLRQVDPIFPSEDDAKWVTHVAKDNEIISALATSIAALARVKDL